MEHRMFNPPHPGGMIKRTYFDPFPDVTVELVSERLKTDQSTLEQLLDEQLDISADLAIRLEMVLGRSAESWLSMQSTYDLWHASQLIDRSDFKKIDFMTRA